MRPSAYLKVVLITCFALSLGAAQTWQYLGLRNFYITALTVDPKNSDVIYAGSIGDFSSGLPGGLFKTTNAGATWDTLLRWVSPQQIVIHPESSNIVFVASGTANGSPPGIFKSVNGGLTWSHSDSGLIINPDRGVATVAINPKDPRVMYAGTGGIAGGTVYKSTNGGRSWFFPGEGISDNNMMKILLHPYHPDTLYLATAGVGAVFRSFDAGAVWDSVLWQVDLVNDLILDKTEPEIIYCLIPFGVGGPFARTTDRGQTWFRSRIAGDTRNESYSIVLNPTNRNEIFAAVGAIDQSLRGVYRSTNQGELMVEYE